MNKLKRSSAGFTLVEMSAVVVVLSIIGFGVVGASVAGIGLIRSLGTGRQKTRNLPFFESFYVERALGSGPKITVIGGGSGLRGDGTRHHGHAHLRHHSNAAHAGDLLLDAGFERLRAGEPPGSRRDAQSPCPAVTAASGPAESETAAPGGTAAAVCREGLRALSRGRRPAAGHRRAARSVPRPRGRPAPATARR